MSDEADPRSTPDTVEVRGEDIRTPEVGYRIVEWEPRGPVTPLMLHWSRSQLVLSEVSIPQNADPADCSVLDRYGTEYATQEFLDRVAKPGPEGIPEAIQGLEDGSETERRLAGAQLKRIAEQYPDACEPAVPVLVDRLSSSDLAVQAETVGIFEALASATPALVIPAVDTLGELLTAETDDRLLRTTLTVIRRVAEEDTSAVTELVPRLEPLLKDDTGDEVRTLLVLEHVADSHPETLLPITPTLVEYVTNTSRGGRIGALSVLGRVSKAYPNVGTEVVPVARELLTVDDDKLRTNAAGLLADQAEQYPEAVLPAVPAVIGLLDDENEQTRYNATSVLARVADHDPDTVEPATESLIDALEEEQAAARENACWALGRIEATTATDALGRHVAHDTNERVRTVASWALNEIAEP